MNSNNDFTLKKLKWIVENNRPITYGIVQAGEDVEGGVPYIRPVDMTDEYGLKTKNLRTTSIDIASAYKRSEVKSGDLVVSIGPSYGKVLEVPEWLSGANLTQGTARVSPNKFQADRRFIFWCLRSSYVYSQWAREINATTFAGLNLEPLSNSYIPLPSLNRQQELAAYLDRETVRIDALVEKKTRFIELLREKRQALITHAVTKGLDPKVKMEDSGVEWLGEVPEHWAVKKLRHLCSDVKAGPFGSSLTKDMYSTSGYRVYGQEQVIPGDFSIGDYFISEKLFNELRQYEVQSGDVLVSCVGTFGKVAVVPSSAAPGIINPRLLRLRANRLVSPEYLGEVLKSPIVFEQFSIFSRGGTMDVINVGTLGSIVVPVPPYNEQAAILMEIANIKRRFDSLVVKTERSIELLKERRSALITASVTGQIDLREAA